MRIHKLVGLFLLLLPVSTAGAQSIWDGAHLARVKASLEQPAYATAYRHLLDEAESELQRQPLSVMMKEKVPASGDKHDYLSLSRCGSFGKLRIISSRFFILCLTGFNLTVICVT